MPHCLKAMWNTFSACLACSAEGAIEAISLALHSVSHGRSTMECKRDSFNSAPGGARETHWERVTHRLKVMWKFDITSQAEACEASQAEAESKAKDQQCNGRHIVEVSKLAKNFTACSVVVSFRSTFLKTWYRNLYNFLSPKLRGRLLPNFSTCSG